MEWFWDELGIEATTEIAKVKQAYVKQMRHYKNLEIKEEVSSEIYNRLAEAEAAAIAYIESQGRPLVTGKKEVDNISTALPIQVSEGKQSKTREAEIQREAASLATERSRLEAQQGAEAERQRQVAAIEAKIAAAEADRVAKLTLAASEQAKQQQDREARQKKQEQLNLQPTQENYPKAALAVKESQPAAVEKKQPLNASGAKINNKNQPTSQVSQPFKNKLTKLKALLNEWPDKIEVSQWKQILGVGSSWSLAERRYLEREFLPDLAKELIYLPEDVLVYLYDSLKLGEIDQKSDYVWYQKIAALPKFSFTIAYHIPDQEHEEYFAKRYQLYQALQQSDGQSHQVEVENLADELFDLLVELTGSSEGDQDLINLGALDLIMARADLLSPINGPQWHLTDQYKLADIPSEKQTNPTTKFLQIVFDTYQSNQISVADSLFIETTTATYIPEGLRHYLIGLAFYRSGDFVKSDKYFAKLTSDYAKFVKPLRRKQPATGYVSGPNFRNQPKVQKNYDWQLIMRIGLVVLVGLGLLINLFAGAEDDNFDDYFEEEVITPEPSVSFDNNQRIIEDFTELFTRNFHEEYAAVERNYFIEDHVSGELVQTFLDFEEKQSSSAALSKGTIVNFLTRPVESDDQTSSWLNLITVNGEAIVVFKIEDGLVVEAKGPQWDQTSQEDLDQLAASLLIKPSEINQAFMQEFYLESEEGRLFNLDKYAYLLSPYSSGIDEVGTGVNFPAKLRDGYYRYLKIDHNSSLMMYFDADDQVMMYLNLDEFGRYINFWDIASAPFAQNDLETLLKQAEPAVPVLAQ